MAENPVTSGPSTESPPQTVEAQTAKPSSDWRGAEHGIKCNYDFRQQTEEQLREMTQCVKQMTQDAYDRVGALSEDELTFDNVVKPLVDVENETFHLIMAIKIPSMVATDAKLRECSSEMEKELLGFFVDQEMRKDVFHNLQDYSLTSEFDSIDPEYQRFVEKTVEDGKLNGLHLSTKMREKVIKLRKKISELGVMFSMNLNNDDTCIHLEAGQLPGVPEDVINSMERSADGKVRVTMKYPHYVPVSKYCSNPNTRMLIEKSFLSRPKENVAIIEKLVKLRHKQARLLGFKNHCAYVLKQRMADNPEKVNEFLSDVQYKAGQLWAKEKKEMLDLKAADAQDSTTCHTRKMIEFYDIKYYKNILEKTKYNVDRQKLKEYFPMEKVTKGMMEIYQKVLGLKFTRVDGSVWHDDVELWEVMDAQTQEVLGFFYLDLFPRPGKYGHACKDQLQPGYVDSKGVRQKSVVIMLCNFTKPTPDKPSLLDHGEVLTYFHEFGHVMHGICSKTKTARFFGTNVERDFVEAPSQMFENWVWEETPLRMMSGHYKDNSPIPQDMLESLMKAKHANSGVNVMSQMFFAKYDQILHTTDEVDSEDLFKRTFKTVLGVETIPGTNLASSFNHLVGYDGQYYGYLWSSVFSADMFLTRFAAEGIMNPETGMDYRRSILEPGGTKDAYEMLEDFLGRPPNNEAFFKDLGLDE